ncbi:MAG TPA: protein kinase [Vicinamibacteria bacterium]|nr:protein kinase [Vicinamibacteria bacterium]
MPLSHGARLGPYEVSGLVGTGGMGEVYRARDTRLGREVALKVIPEDLARDRDRLGRFEREARATAGLSHPNILALFDVGVEGEVHYIVEELLEGQTLRERLRHGKLPVREAVAYGVQIAQALAVAHEHGIVHRDLKPENVFLTRDSRVKVLDFGLAKLHESGPHGTEVTATAATDEGTRLGTVGYMSPEQTRGEAADARSDIFSLGAVLYEMLSGQRAFQKPTAVETLHAILNEDPSELSGVGTTIPVALDRVVRRCLEKPAGSRFQSAHDVALALEAASAVGSGAMAAPTRPWPSWQRWALRGLLAVATVAAFAAVYVAGRRSERRPVPSYRQLTFRRGFVDHARFAPDGQTFVYSARWEGKPSETFSARLDLVEAEALSLAQGARLAGLRGGEALVLDEDRRLARLPLVGGTPRDVAENVGDADWGPTGDIAVIRRQDAESRWWLEYPVGRRILEPSPFHPLWDVRISPQGDRAAVVEGLFGANAGKVVVVDRAGRRTALSSDWAEIYGLAWSPDGREVWFSASGTAAGVGEATSGAVKELHAVSLAGRERMLLRTAGDLTLQDAFRDGRVLVTHGRTRGEARGKLAGDEKERDLTYLDGTITVGISDDGRAVLFQEESQTGHNAANLRRVDDLAPIRLSDVAGAVALSPDGRRALGLAGSLNQSGSRHVLLSAGPEPPRELPHGTVDGVGWAWWTPDGQHVIFWGREKNHPRRTWIEEPPDGQPRPISPEGTECRPAWPGWAVCQRVPEERDTTGSTWDLRSLTSGATRPAAWIGGAVPIAWSPDGRHAFVAGSEQPPFRVFRVDEATGRRETWLDASPPDPAGLSPAPFVAAAITPDGRYYVYSYDRTLSDLFLVDDLR